MADVRFLADEIADRLVDRLDDLNRSFDLAADLSPVAGPVHERLAAHPKIGRVVSLAEVGDRRQVTASLDVLPLAAEAVDCLLCLGGLHWIDDLPGTLIQMRRCLKPDGLLLAAMAGGNTLAELAECLVDAELAVTGGARPRVAPFTDIRDLGQLLQRAGLALPVVDLERLEVSYPGPLDLMGELRLMGEANGLIERSASGLRRDVLAAAMALYSERHARTDGRIVATFEILMVTAWAPAEGQQRPARRGSGDVSLARFFDPASEPDRKT
ncbi:MAG: methyltransferase domain-containing protein [Geminicoccaceae bacterium]